MPTALNDYQQRVLDKLYDADTNPHGVIAYHGLGAGKTYTALSAAAKALADKDTKGLWVAPASLTSNVEAERKKHGLNFGGKLDVMSYEKARNKAADLAKQKYGLVVLDEAHRLRNEGTSIRSALQPVLDNSNKVLMLTGTAGYNRPSDVYQLLKLVGDKKDLPGSEQAFTDKFVDQENWTLKNKPELKKILNKYIDVYERPKDAKDYPTVQREIRQVGMSPDQVALYSYLEKKLPLHLQLKVKSNLPMGVQDATALNVFSTGIRQASDSTGHHYPNKPATTSVKLQEAANRMAEMAKQPGFRGVAYSNYLDAGVNPYAEVLREKGLDPLVFTGKLNAKEKAALVDRYNKPGDKPQVLLLSSSGGEGLDLKNTRLMQVLEPHFNRAKIQQVIGRGARYKSHASLPEDQRNMLVEEYHSTLPRRGFLQKLRMKGPDTSIDQYLDQLANRKQGLIEELRELAR